MQNTVLILVRHCEAAGNRDRVFQGRFDGPITETGQRQLACLARRLEGIRLDAVYTGPLQRARRTAEAVIGTRPLTAREEARLTEIDGGDWERMLWSEIARVYPEEFRCWKEHPGAFAAPHGETMAEVYARVSAALTELADRHRGQTAVLASHGCAIRNALCFAHGLPVERIGEIGWSDNTAVTELMWDGAWHVLRENDASHLTEDCRPDNRTSFWK